MNKKTLAIWSHPYSDVKPKGAEAQFKRMFEMFAESGISVYIPFMASEGKAWYGTEILQTEHDYLSVILELAKQFNIKVYPILGFGKISSLAPQWTYKATVPDGEEAPFSVGRSLCASWKQNRDTLVRVVDELVSNYPVDGLQLDYFRYPNMEFQIKYPCECEACGDRREGWLGHRKLTKEDMAVPSIIYRELRQKHESIYEVLLRIHRVVRKRGMKLSLAARARYLKDALYEGQDWYSWIHEGLFDVVYPMSYNDCRERFQGFLDQHLRLTRNAPVKYMAGVGKKSSLSDLSTDELIWQITTALDEGADGVAIFAYWGMTPADFQALSKIRHLFEPKLVKPARPVLAQVSK